MRMGYICFISSLTLLLKEEGSVLIEDWFYLILINQMP